MSTPSSSTIADQFLQSVDLARYSDRVAPWHVEDPTITVLVRTTGKRSAEGLRAALSSLGRQTDPDFKAIVLVHTPDPLICKRVAQVVRASPVEGRVIPVQGGERGRPLNVGISMADTSHVTFLDDDDLALDTWIEVFRREARQTPRIVRSLTIQRPVRRAEGGRVEVVGEDIVPETSDSFDLLTVFTRNRTPLCSLAVPVAPLEEFGIQFPEDLPALEDFEFLIRATSLIGVHESGKTTSIYHRWQDGRSTVDLVGGVRWEALRREVFQRLDEHPLLLPEGSVSRLVGLYEQIADQQRSLQEQKSAIAQLQKIKSSTSWRATAPLRSFMDWLRSRRA